MTLTLRTESAGACPLCGGVEISPLLQGFDFDHGTGNYRIDRCRTCGMRFTNPQVIAANVRLLYDDRTYDELPNGTSPFGWLRAARVHAWLRHFCRPTPIHEPHPVSLDARRDLELS